MMAIFINMIIVIKIGEKNNIKCIQHIIIIIIEKCKCDVYLLKKINKKLYLFWVHTLQFPWWLLIRSKDAISHWNYLWIYMCVFNDLLIYCYKNLTNEKHLDFKNV